MDVIVRTTEEFETQREKILRSITRAERLINSMETIEEREIDRIQDFIAYSIPRSPLLFNERQRFRNILKELSLGKIEKKQAIENIISLKCEIIN